MLFRGVVVWRPNHTVRCICRPGVSTEEKMLKRYQKERAKRHNKRDIFNLHDDEGCVSCRSVG